MAKDPKMNIFARTEQPKPEKQQPDNSDLDLGNVKATGVGLRVGELAALDAIGAELGELLGSEPVARNTLMREAVRRFILAFRAGDITIDDLAKKFERPEKPKPKYIP